MTSIVDPRPGMAGREDSWNYSNDQLWDFEYSANEIILTPGVDLAEGKLRGPSLSAQRALGLLIERFGPDKLHRLIDEMATGLYDEPERWSQR